MYMAVTSFINTNRLRHRVLTDIHLCEGVKRASSGAPVARRPQRANGKRIFREPNMYRFVGVNRKLQTVNKSGRLA